MWSTYHTHTKPTCMVWANAGLAWVCPRSYCTAPMCKPAWKRRTPTTPCLHGPRGLNCAGPMQCLCGCIDWVLCNCYSYLSSGRHANSRETDSACFIWPQVLHSTFHTHLECFLHQCVYIIQRCKTLANNCRSHWLLHAHTFTGLYTTSNAITHITALVGKLTCSRVRIYAALYKIYNVTKAVKYMNQKSCF